MSVFLLIAMLVVLIVVHELGHFTAAKLLGVRVEEFGVGYPPRAFLIAVVKGTQYTINWLPFGGFVRLLEEDGMERPESRPRGGSFAAAPKWKQALILLAGVIANVIFGWILFTAGLMNGMPVVAETAVENARLFVTKIVPGSPAEYAGIRVGDEITSVDEKNKAQIAELTPTSVMEFVRSRGGKPIDVTYVRHDVAQTVTLAPAHAILPDSPSQPAIGMGLQLVAEQKLPLGSALVEGARHTWYALESVVFGMGTLVRNAFLGSADIRVLVGPVGLVSVVGDASAHGIGEFLGLAALISINLVIINLLPIPALDGGRLVFVVLESIRRRKISRTIAQILNTLGFAFIIVLMVAVTYNDIARLIG